MAAAALPVLVAGPGLCPCKRRSVSRRFIAAMAAPRALMRPSAWRAFVARSRVLIVSDDAADALFVAGVAACADEQPLLREGV